MDNRVKQQTFGDYPAPHGDLREWLQRAQQAGEVKVITGADWNREIGAIAEMITNHAPGRAPALLFDEIKGYPKGFRVLSGMTDSPTRLALTLGFPKPDSEMELVRGYRDRMRNFTLIPPTARNTGSVLENVIEEDDVDVLKFPVPFINELDGGRYIGTASVVVMRDPDSGWVNLGTYRIQVQDRNTVSLGIAPAHHGLEISKKYLDKGKPCPILICVGQDPLLFLAACNDVAHGVDEYAYAGGHRGSPFDVVAGKLTGLPMPADAEIVLEGEVVPGEARPEGPFGEWTGYYGGGVADKPIVRVKRIYHRNDPILTMARYSRPPADSIFSKCVIKSAMIWEQIEKAGLPGVSGVWSHVSGGGGFFNVVAIKQAYAGHAKQALLLAAGAVSANASGQYVVVVDDDIDPSNLFDVTWAISSRCDPAEDIDIVRRAMATRVNPRLRPGSPNLTSRALIDACRPFEWIDEFPAVAESSPELRAETYRKWGHLLDD